MVWAAPVAAAAEVAGAEALEAAPLVPPDLAKAARIASTLDEQIFSGQGGGVAIRGGREQRVFWCTKGRDLWRES